VVVNPEQLALLEMYKEHAAQARQHESQRQQMTALVVAVAAALVGFVAANLKAPTVGLFAPGVFLIFLGGYAALFSRKHYERNRMHTAVMDAFRQQLERRLDNVQLGLIREQAEAAHNHRFPSLHKRRLHLFWDWLNGSVAVVGLILVIVVTLAIAFAGPAAAPDGAGGR
jgi:hypothetical protein